MHVDDFIRDISEKENENYARFFFMLHRLPAIMQHKLSPWMWQFKLFCTYQEQRYRCTGASRLGDVWLTADFDQQNGYDVRVNVADCTEWKDRP